MAAEEAAQKSKRHVTVDLGYSPRMSEGGEFGRSLEALQEILGEFQDIALHTLRLGESFYQVAITRTVKGAQRTDTVAGRIGDYLRLSNGAKLFMHLPERSAITLVFHRP